VLRFPGTNELRVSGSHLSTSLSVSLMVESPRASPAVAQTVFVHVSAAPAKPFILAILTFSCFPRLPDRATASQIASELSKSFEPSQAQTGWTATTSTTRRHLPRVLSWHRIQGTPSESRAQWPGHHLRWTTMTCWCSPDLCAAPWQSGTKTEVARRWRAHAGLRQGLTLVYFSAQHEPFLRHEHTLHTP